MINMADETTANVRAVKRARACWVLVAFVGLGFLIGPAFTYRGLTTQHIVAHLITGPAMIALSLVRLRHVVHAGIAYRTIDVLLVASGVWLASLPFVIPAGGLHIPGHAAAGILVSSAAMWNAVSR